VTVWTTEQVIQQGVPFNELVEEYMGDVLLQPDGDAPFTGLAYELSVNGEKLLYYGEYTDGIPHGISVFYHPNGNLKSKDAIFHGTGHGWSRSWDEEGNLIFLGEYMHGISVRFREWDGKGRLTDEKKEPDAIERAIIDQRIQENKERWPEEAAGLTYDFLENKGWPEE
jgi:antitoxin component YwqK of YwqJK toxin-antitoxin module